MAILIPKFMLKPAGNITRFDPDPKAGGPAFAREADTFFCHHHGGHVEIKKSFQEESGWCFICRKVICLQCVDEDRCNPIEKQLEAWEKAGRKKLII